MPKDHSLIQVSSFQREKQNNKQCDLYPEELYPSIEKAYEQQLIDSCFVTLEDVGNVLTQRKENHLFNLLKKSELIEDTVTEMEKWISSGENSVKE